MTTSLRPLKIRSKLGHTWSIPKEFGPDGWIFTRSDTSIIVTVAEFDNIEWIHASIASERLPTYNELKLLHHAVFLDGYAYQVFPPKTEHVNIHPNALHLWGRLDGKPHLPNFINGMGSI